ncbi:MAG: virulence factor [Acidobacteriota bacterium]|nr:virulence factor [Acidobacteriota bacterium]
MMIFLFAVAMTCNAPVIELPATAGASDRFAVLLTGDGGWRRVDDEVATVLRAQGIPIVGLDVPAYFETRRTPEESACALEQIIRTYQQRWQKQHVILIGYSRGADVLPFMASRLPAEILTSVQLVALLGPEPLIDFRFHPWWDPKRYFRHEEQFPVLPEVEKLPPDKVLCVYGDAEKNTLCTQLDRRFTTVSESGGHHFGGNYDDVARAILTAAR